MSEQDNSASLDRRHLLQVAAGLGVLGITPLAAAQTVPNNEPRPAMKLPPGWEKLKIAMLVHPQMIVQDIVGPATIFNFMASDIQLAWKNKNPVATDLPFMSVTPTATFDEVPKDLDIIFVPGGLAGSIACMQDPEVVNFIRDRGSRAKYVTSICTGALVLGAAGLLKGYRATGHWYIRDMLSYMGATVVHDRVVEDRNRITSGAVTAGFDFGLKLNARIRDLPSALRTQLTLEYDPQPPFDAGSPEKAPKEITEMVLKMRAPVLEKAKEAAIAAGKSLGI